MKPQSLSGDHESKGTIREKLKQICEAAMDVMAKNGVQRGHRIPISKDVERLSSNHYAEEPIRTMMLLGSWSHT
ncbi:hypothetical protein GQ457_01G053700 [Hibiscus cannabinus]